MRIFGRSLDPKINDIKQLKQFAKIFSQLKQGDLIKGEILNISRENVLLKMLNGTTVNARLDEPIDLRIGELLDFEVQSNNDGQLLIKPHAEHTTDSKISMVYEALKAAGLAENEENTNLIQILIDLKLPINKESIQKIMQQMKKNEGMTLESLIFMLKNDMPINKETSEYLNGYVTNNLKLSDQLSELITNIKSMDDPNVKKQILELLQNGIENKVTELSKEDIIKTFNQDEIQKLASEKLILPGIEKGKYQINIEKLFEELNIKKGNIDNILSKLIDKVLEKNISESMFIKYDDRESFKELNKFYNNIYEKTSEINKLLQGQSGDSIERVAINITDIKENIDFLQQLNDHITYLQIPLQFSNSLTQGNLYLIEDKNNNGNKRNKDSKTALLSLDMSSLGHVEAFVMLNKKSIQCNFRVENDRIKNIISEKLIKLKNVLYHKGYSLEKISVNTLDSPFNILKIDKMQKELTDNEENKRRYTFDMRV